MTDLQAKAEAAADAACAPYGSVEGHSHWPIAYAAALHALQSERWRPGDKAICTVDGHEHEVTILGKHETHWRIDFGGFQSHAPEWRLRLPTPPEGETQ